MECIVDGLQRPRDVALDLFAGRVYWVDDVPRSPEFQAPVGKIQSDNLDGSDVQDVVTGLAGPSSLTLQAERLQQCEPVADPDVRTQGFWKRVARKPHPSGEYKRLPSYAGCISATETFAEVDSRADIRNQLNPKPKNSKCEQAEAQFMALLLNVCSGRVAECNLVHDPDLGETTIGAVIGFIDAILSDPHPARADCVLAQAIADRINNGLTLVITP